MNIISFENNLLPISHHYTSLFNQSFLKIIIKLPSFKLYTNNNAKCINITKCMILFYILPWYTCFTNMLYKKVRI